MRAHAAVRSLLLLGTASPALLSLRPPKGSIEPGLHVALLLPAWCCATALGEAAGGLPPHHSDPFDRLLIAQGRLEGLTILTADAMFARYDVALA